MKKQDTRKRSTVVLSGFGAALSLVAANLAQAETVARPALKAPQIKVSQLTKPAALRSLVTYDKAKLCKPNHTTCLTGLPYVKKLSAGQMKKLRVLIGLGVQTDIKDACLVC